MASLTPDQSDALRHYFGQEVYDGHGRRWYPKAVTTKALVRRGLLDRLESTVPDEFGRPRWHVEFRVTEAGLRALEADR